MATLNCVCRTPASIYLSNAFKGFHSASNPAHPWLQVALPFVGGNKTEVRDRLSFLKSIPRKLSHTRSDSSLGSSTMVCLPPNLVLISSHISLDIIALLFCMYSNVAHAAAPHQALLFSVTCFHTPLNG